MDRPTVLFGDFVVRQMRMEIQRGDVLEQAQLVNVPESRDRRDVLRAFDECRTESPEVVHRHVERLHQRAGILPEALLARNECVAVVEVFHLTLLEVVGEADIMVRREQQASAFTLEPLTNGCDLVRRSLLLGKNVVEPNTQSVSVSARIRSSIGSL